MATATQNKTYYDVLGVPRSASAEEIRKAYLKLAKQHHPDKTGGDKAAEEKLKTINEAYQTLKNPEKRKEYDAQLDAAEAWGGMNWRGAGRGGAAFDERVFRDTGGFGEAFGGGLSGFEDLFGSIFGHDASARSRRPQAGSDLEAQVTVSLEEVSRGVRKHLRISRREPCGTCHGNGAKPGTRPARCPRCHGTGQTRQAQGPFQFSQTCPQCHGAGETAVEPCRVCNGRGWARGTRRLAVDIPAGIEDGARLRLAGEGELGGHGGPRGDLYVAVRVAPHPMFKREGADLVCEAPIRMTEAALGGKVRVPTLEGAAELRIQPGAQSGAVLRMRGQGLPRYGGQGRGDQLVRLHVETPHNLSSEQMQQLQAFARGAGPRNYPRAEAFEQRTRQRRRK